MDPAIIAVLLLLGIFDVPMAIAAGIGYVIGRAAHKLYVGRREANESGI